MVCVTLRSQNFYAAKLSGVPGAPSKSMKPMLGNAASELCRGCEIALPMVCVTWINCALEDKPISPSHSPSYLNRSIYLWMLNVQFVLTGISSLSLQSCLQVTGAVFRECNGYV